MIQVASFPLPQEQEAANTFLLTHKPVETVHFNKDIIVIIYDTYETTPELEIAEIKELIQSNFNAQYQHEVALFMLKREQAGVPTNMARYDELASAIKATEEAIDNQEAKREFAQKKIAELQAK